MKITKQRLKEIIKEELSGLGDSQETRRANPNENTLRLADVATRVGGSEFATAVSAAMMHAISTPENTGGHPAMGMMAAALKTLTLSRPESALEEGPDNWAQDAAADIKKKGTEGEFTKYCDGDVTQACVDRAAKGNSTKRKRQAAFAANVNSNDDLVYPKDKKQKD